MDSPRSPAEDLVQPFQLETGAAQGRLVRLAGVAEEILGLHDYPEAVAHMLGEGLTLAALLSGALKFDGVLTFQIKGDGPINMLVADITTEGEMRGYAQFDKARLAEAEADFAEGKGPVEPVPQLFGNGHLAFTVDQGPDTDRYQGIVELTGATLAECAHGYFRQSAQLNAVVKLAVGRSGDGSWRAAGLMIQRSPDRGPIKLSGDAPDEDWEEDWRRAVILMGSSTSGELLDPALHPHDLLYRLFHEDGVRVFTPVPLAMSCRCSEQRVITMLRSFPRREIEALKEGDRVVVTCEFCSRRYDFDESALDAVYDS